MDCFIHFYLLILGLRQYAVTPIFWVLPLPEKLYSAQKKEYRSLNFYVLNPQFTKSFVQNIRYNKVTVRRRIDLMEQAHIDKVKSFVSEHLKDEFSLDEIARFVGYSAYHFAREFKGVTGQSIMEYVREQRIYASAIEISHGKGICEVAMDYCFGTHAGFTRAFTAQFGVSPKEYAEHARKPKTKGIKLVENSKIVIRPICKDDVQDLWENVYSAMTPRQITEVKILPSIEKLERREGIHLVAQVDGKVVMALPMEKPFGLPLGFLFDNNFVLTGGDNDAVMEKMLAEMKRQCKMMNVSTLISPQYENSESCKAFLHFGFTKAYTSDGWDYLMIAI